jgi:hypothetical protein
MLLALKNHVVAKNVRHPQFRMSNAAQQAGK